MTCLLLLKSPSSLASLPDSSFPSHFAQNTLDYVVSHDQVINGRLDRSLWQEVEETLHVNQTDSAAAVYDG